MLLAVALCLQRRRQNTPAPSVEPTSTPPPSTVAAQAPNRRLLSQGVGLLPSSHKMRSVRFFEQVMICNVAPSRRTSATGRWQTRRAQKEWKGEAKGKREETYTYLHQLVPFTLPPIFSESSFPRPRAAGPPDSGADRCCVTHVDEVV
jgi:hypothetical protein